MTIFFLQNISIGHVAAALGPEMSLTKSNPKYTLTLFKIVELQRSFLAAAFGPLLG